METWKMKLSVLLLLALQALSSASPLDIGNNTEQRNVSFMNSDPNGSPEITTYRSMLTDLPLLTVAKLRQKRQFQAQSASFMYGDGFNLEWVTWNNSLPNDAVFIYNSYVDRIDYVCKYRCEAGFYTPSKGPFCHHTNTKTKNDFEILVNKDNFDILEWKEDSYGSVPQNSVRTCPGKDIYVGKNKYGLGKVVTNDKVFYLPWEDSEYWYHYYQVLTINQNIISQQIYNVRYNINDSKIYHYPSEIMRKSTIRNNECHPVAKTDTVSKTYQVEQRWDFTFAINIGVKTNIRAGFPFIASAGIEISTEMMFQFSKATTVIEAITDTVSVEITAPPNYSCIINMTRSKYKVDIPFTAHLTRTYSNGEIRTTSITGTYNSVQIGEVQAEVDRCEPLENSNICM